MPLCQIHGTEIHERDGETWCNVCEWEELQANPRNVGPVHTCSGCGVNIVPDSLGEDALCGTCEVASRMPWAGGA